MSVQSITPALRSETQQQAAAKREQRYRREQDEALGYLIDVFDGLDDHEGQVESLKALRTLVDDRRVVTAINERLELVLEVAGWCVQCECQPNEGPNGEWVCPLCREEVGR